MIRKTLVGLSSLLALAVAVLGLISCWTAQRWTVNGMAPRRAERLAGTVRGPERGGEMAFSRGRIYVQFWRRWERPITSEEAGLDSSDSRFRRQPRRYNRLPLGIEWGTVQGGMIEWLRSPPVAVGWSNGVLVMPCWPVVLLFASCPMAAFVRTMPRRRRARRRRMGLCGGCGYNLTGNVTGVCPECGQVT